MPAVITGPIEKGFQRAAWDLRAPAHVLPPNRPRSEVEELFDDPLVGPLVVPGRYTATLSQRVGGGVSQLAGPVTFNVVLDPQAPHTAADQTARWEFQQKLQSLRRDVAGSLELATSTGAKLTATLLQELKRRKARYGMVTMCVGGGMGAAGIFERM